MDNRKKVTSNIIASVFGYVVSIIIGLVLPRFFTLTYGSEVNGLLGSVNQYVVYLGLFEAGIGIATLQALYKPVAISDKGRICSVMNATGVYYRKAGLYYLIGLVILCFGYPLLVKTEISYFKVSGIIFFTGFVNVLNFWIQGKYVVLLRAEGKNYIVTNLTTVSTVLTGVLKIILISLKVDVLVIMAVSFCVGVSTMLFVLIYMKTKYKWLDKAIPADFESISQKNSVLVHEISWLIFNNTDIIILTSVCGLKIVSVYTMYKLVTTQLGSILSIIPNSVEFSLGQLFQTNKEEYATRADICESLYSTAFFSIYSTALFLFIPFMRLYTSGITDVNYIDYRLAVLFVAIEVLSSMRVIMNQAINFAGHFKLTISRTITESALNLAVSLVLVHFWGIIGVLLGTVVALLYRTNDIIIYSNKRLLGRSPAKTYLIHLLNLAILIGLQFVFRLLPEINGIFDFILYGAVTVLATGIVMLAVQMIVFPGFRKFIVGEVRNVCKGKAK